MSVTGKQFLLVRAGNRRVGLELTQVMEIIEVGAVHPVPSVEPAVRGIAAVHGRAVPVVHLGALLDAAACPRAGANLVVLVMVDGRQLGLEIDDAEVVMRETALPVPTGRALPWAVGVARHPGGLVPLLDLGALSSRFSEVPSA